MFRAMKLIEEYDLTKEDWDSIIELGQFEGQRDPVISIPLKVKAAFTRSCHKESHKRPYAIHAAAKKGRRGRAGRGQPDDGGRELCDDEEWMMKCEKSFQ